MRFSDEKLMDIGNNIRISRKNKNMSLDNLSIKTGLSQTMLRRIECGKRKSLSVEDVSIIADALTEDANTIINEVLSPKIEIDDMQSDIVLHALFPNLTTQNYKILSMYQFMLYLPLISPSLVYGVLLRIQGDYARNDSYILQKVQDCYSTIKNKNAKKYADYISMQLTYQGYKSTKIIKKISCDPDVLSKSMLDGTSSYYLDQNCHDMFANAQEYVKCRQAYMDAAEKCHEAIKKIDWTFED